MRIDSYRFQETLKLTGYTQTRIAEELFPLYDNLKDCDYLRKSINRSISTGSMDDYRVHEICRLIDVSVNYINGKQTIKATTKKQKKRMDSLGDYIPTFREYQYETEVLPKIAKFIEEDKYPGADYFKYLFEKYEITSADGVRYKYDEFPHKLLEEPIKDAIQAWFSQWDYKGYPHVTWKIESDEEE